MSAVIDIKEIVDLLTVRIEALCSDVLPSGRREGHDWVDAHVSAGGLGDSMRVCINGARQGVWAHFAASGARGDALELIAYVLFGGDKKKAIDYAKSWLGLDDADPTRLKQQRLKAAAKRKSNEDKAAKQEEGRRKYAHKMWLGGENILNTPVDMYLGGRWLDVRKMAKPPAALRYVKTLKHANGNFYPAMVAAVYNSHGEFCAVHRTYLHVRGDGMVSKADLGESAKMVLGSYAGAFITLQRGASGKSFKDAPVGDKVILCEGIEDGLSLAMACPDYRVLACVSVNNFRNIMLPENIKDVVIAADNDVAGSPADKSLTQAVNVFIAQGRDVSVARSPNGKDFNDLLREGVQA